MSAVLSKVAPAWVKWRVLVVACLLAAWSTLAPAAPADDIAAVPTFEETCFGDFDDSREYPTPAELQELLVAVPGHEGTMTEATKRLGGSQRRITQVSGIFRLKVNWQADTALRLSLLDPELCQLHFWSGPSGVTLRYCPAALNTWGAYGTTRSGTKPQPESFAIWGLDCGRYRRSGLGTVEVRYQQGNLLLTRGNLRLLSVPLPAPPEEVYLEASACVRGFSVYRCRGGPALPKPNPAVLRLERPAEGQWETTLPEGAAFTRRPDGAVELTAPQGVASAQAGIKIPGPDLLEYLFDLENPQPGTGIYLADAAGKHVARLAFFQDRQSGQTALAWLAPDAEESRMSFDFERAIVPWAGPRQRLRLTLGGGVLKCWTSGDGVHWSQALFSPNPVQGPVTRVGLFCVRALGERSIRLRSLELRQIEALTSLVPAELQQRATVAAEEATFDQWQRRVTDSRPAEVPAEVWQRACILRTLAQNPNFAFGAVLIHRLLDEVLSEPRDPQAQLQLLEQAAWLAQNLDWQSTEPFGRHYQRLGLRLSRGGVADPLGAVSHAILDTPLWNKEQQNAWPDELLRRELLLAAMEDRWPEVSQQLDRLYYWQRPGRLEGRWPPWDRQTEYVLSWAEAELSRREKPRPEQFSPMSRSWQGPLVEKLGKESYNVFGEFHSALQARAYRDACQVIATAPVSIIPGVMRDADDPRLLVSFPIAVRLALQRHEPLLKAMREHFGPLGQLRLKQAASAGDAGAAEALAVQFCGTEAAAEAHQWLGDRELSSGRMVQAAGHYRRALADASVGQRPALSARLRLAAAILGEDRGEPMTEPVEIGSTRLDGPAFEQLVQEIRQAQRRDAPPGTSRSEGAFLDVDRGQPVGNCVVRKWATLQGQAGERPPALPDRADWPAQQIAVAFTDTQMIVSNQVELAAFELASGKRQWSDRPSLPYGCANWPATAMQPVPDGTRIFARRLTGNGPELACYQAGDGRVLWSCRPSTYVATDPLPLGPWVFALTARKDLSGQLSLLLAQLDARTGRLLSEAPLAEFRDPGWRRFSARAALVGDRIVATAPGYVIACDLSGAVLWIRQQIGLPAPASESLPAGLWAGQRHQRPLWIDGRLVVAQPGGWSVECLDPETGRLLWRKAVPELVAVVGSLRSHVIVETADGFSALDPATGSVLWHHEAPQRLEGAWCSPAMGVVYTRAQGPESAGNGAGWALVCLDAATGRELWTVAPAGPRQQQPAVGPLAPLGPRLWAFVAGAGNRATREIVEIVGEPERIGESEKN